ncbi:MAG TPA: ABC transporter substrate-binding protein [Acidimicrobiales bacterium]|nr:ABC transporter substrate-binding protein [Acidimicrobiales bacterium]
MRGKWKAGLLATALTAGTFVGISTAAVSLVTASPAAAAQQPLNLANEQGLLWPCSFNPFNPSDAPYSVGLTYETLDFVDALNNAKVTPWLASSYAWSNGNKTLTFTIRSGVKWTDGKPLTAADVVYTFNLIKAHSALDVNAVWTVLTSVTAKGANQVVFQFKAPAVPYFYYIAGQTPIVPQHIWSKIANPVSDAVSNPLGSGGYIMSKCTPQNIQWTANPHYWQMGMDQVKVVNMPAFLSNNTCNEYLAQGKSAWGSQFIPNIKSYFVDKKAGNGYWFPPVANVSLFPNLTKAPLNDAKVRQAISYGLDRATISRIGEYGYEPPANQAGIVSPTFGAWASSAASAAWGNGYNPGKAKSILTSDGYKMVNGVMTKAGKPLAFTIITNGGYSDWVAAVQVMGQELAKIGIKITVNGVAATNFYTDVYDGNFQLAYNVENGGPAPFYEFRQWLFSKNSAPIGTAASSNWERFSSASVDALLNEYTSTTSVAMQHSIMAQLQTVMTTQVPVIPVLEEVDWFQYNSKEYSGFPTPSDEYAQPGLYNIPDWGVVLEHLKPIG